TLPNLHGHSGKKHRWILNALLVLGSWAFLYDFIVAPYRFPSVTPAIYGARFDFLYLGENIALVLMLIALTLSARPPWKRLYLHLLGASALYALSSTIANIAIDDGGYINGKLYGLGLTASVCWFVWVPLSARRVPKTAIRTSRFPDDEG